MWKQTNGQPASPSWASIMPDNMEIDTTATNSFSGTNRTGTNATKIVVQFTLKAKTTGETGQATTLTLQSTFTPHYPNPDKAGDSY